MKGEREERKSQGTGEACEGASILARSLQEHLLKTRYCPFKHIKTRPSSTQFSLWYTIMGAFSCLALLQVLS